MSDYRSSSSGSPEDQEQLALTINGKKRNIHRKEFLILAESCGLMPKVAEHIIAKVCGLKEKFLKQVDEAYLSENQKEKVKENNGDIIKFIEEFYNIK